LKTYTYCNTVHCHLSPESDALCELFAFSLCHSSIDNADSSDCFVLIDRNFLSAVHFNVIMLQLRLTLLNFFFFLKKLYSTNYKLQCKLHCKQSGICITAGERKLQQSTITDGIKAGIVCSRSSYSINMQVSKRTRVKKKSGGVEGPHKCRTVTGQPAHHQTCCSCPDKSVTTKNTGKI